MPESPFWDLFVVCVIVSIAHAIEVEWVLLSRFLTPPDPRPQHFLSNNQSTTMDSYIPKSLAHALAAIGLLYISAKVFSYVRLLASLFLIPGVPVSSSTKSNLNYSNNLSCPSSVPRVAGQS